jgi:hypothetical protein
VVDQTLRRPAALESHDQGIDAQLGTQVIRHRPADDLACCHVLEGCQAHEALENGAGKVCQ